jgi:hypothetical protein
MVESDARLSRLIRGLKHEIDKLLPHPWREVAGSIAEEGDVFVHAPRVRLGDSPVLVAGPVWSDKLQRIALRHPAPQYARLSRRAGRARRTTLGPERA